MLTWGVANSDLGVRGYDQPMSPRLLVLVNGRQVYTDSYGYTAWSTLPVALGEIRQIEVVKGPNSALFGFNAVAGVINIVTANPKYDTVDELDARVGTQSAYSGDFVQTFHLGKQVSARLTVTDAYAKEFADGALTQVQPQERHPYQQTGAALDVLAQITPKLQARVEADWANNQQTMALAQYVYSRSRHLTNSERITLIDESPIGLLQLSAYKNAVTSVLDQLPSAIDFDNYVTVVQAQDLVKLDNRNTVRIAFEYRHNSLNTSPDEAGRVVYDVYSPSLMWNSQLNSSISLTGAIRYDSLKLNFIGQFPAVDPISASDFERTIGAVSANAGVVFKATTSDTLKLAYARGIQAPSLAEFGGVLEAFPEPLPHGELAVIGNPGIQPTVVTNYEAGWDKDLPALKAKAGLRVFYQQTQHVKALPSLSALDLMPTATTAAAIRFQNVGDSKMVGTEFEASGVFGAGYHWSANYLYASVHDEPLPGVNPADHEAAFGASTPKHTANIGLGWADRHWALDGYVQAVSSWHGYQYTYLPVPLAVEPVGGYVTLAGRVAYNITDHLTVSVNGQNLQAAHTTEATGLPVERRVWGGLSARW
jgi:iron complex outermembrane receptor protein